MCFFLRNDCKNHELLNPVETIHVTYTVVENHHFFLGERITEKQRPLTGQASGYQRIRLSVEVVSKAL